MSNLNKRIIDEINLRALTGNLMEKCGASVTIKKQNVSVYVGPGEVLNQVLIYFLIKTKENKQLVFIKDDYSNCFKLFKDQLPNKISTFSIDLVNLMDVFDHKKGYYTNENAVDYNKLKDCCFAKINTLQRRKKCLMLINYFQFQNVMTIICVNMMIYQEILLKL